MAARANVRGELECDRSRMRIERGRANVCALHVDWNAEVSFRGCGETRSGECREEQQGTDQTDTGHVGPESILRGKWT